MLCSVRGDGEAETQHCAARIQVQLEERARTADRGVLQCRAVRILIKWCLQNEVGYSTRDFVFDSNAMEQNLIKLAGSAKWKTGRGINASGECHNVGTQTPQKRTRQTIVCDANAATPLDICLSFFVTLKDRVLHPSVTRSTCTSESGF